jgi:hypothetical protein
MRKLQSASIAMSKELRAFVQMLLAEEYRTSQTSSVQGDVTVKSKKEISQTATTVSTSVTGP